MRSTYTPMSVSVLTVASFVKNATRFGVSIYLNCFEMTIRTDDGLLEVINSLLLEKAISRFQSKFINISNGGDS